jgi:transposase-like protein
LFIFDGPKTLTKAIRAAFGAAAIQGCQFHKGRNIFERVDEPLHTGVK